MSKPQTPPGAARPKDKYDRFTGIGLVFSKARFRYIYLTFLTSLLVLQLFAQDSASAYRQVQNNPRRTRMKNRMRMEEEGDLIFNRQNIFGLHLSSNGYGISYEKGFFRTPRLTTLWQFELNEVHSPKEHHITATYDGYNYSSIVPYKLNNLYEFKIAVGQERLIGGKGNKNGVDVHYLYSGGVSVGLLKPYLLDYSNQITGVSGQLTWPQVENDQNVGDQVTGAAGFTAGWDKLSVKPGLNARQAMRFDYARLNSTVAAIEVGLTEEYYPGGIPLMYTLPAQKFFFGSYVAILFGSRK